MHILLDHGDMFEGNEDQFEDCFFTFTSPTQDPEGRIREIASFAAHWKVQFEIDGKVYEV